MHASMRVHGSGEPGPGIKGMFYPSESEGRSFGAAVPKLIAIVVAMALVRTLVAGKRHNGSSRWNRRREAIAELHRELHERDAAPSEIIDR